MTLPSRPALPPNPDRLSIYPSIFYDPDGNEHEADTADQIHLHRTAAAQLAQWDHDFWRQLHQAKSTALFQTPIQHFLVRGFQARGIDEFLAHITVIEATVGTVSDYRCKNGPYRRLSGPKRVAARLAGLLNDPSAEAKYEELFDLRSAFIHGRAGVNHVSAKQRLCARGLARRATLALTERATVRPLDREVFLDELLDTGVLAVGLTAKS